jgi:hypothetical protein
MQNLSMQNVELLVVKLAGIYSNHSALKGYPGSSCVLATTVTRPQSVRLLRVGLHENAVYSNIVDTIVQFRQGVQDAADVIPTTPGAF